MKTVSLSNMPKIVLALLLSVSETSAKFDLFQSKGSSYQSYGYSYFYKEDCPFENSFSASIYAGQDKFKAIGNNGMKTTNEYEERSVYFMVSECDGGNTLSKVFGGMWEGGPTDSTFTLDTKKYATATLSNMKLPIYRQTCLYQCDEFCWAEIDGYDTCPPYEPERYCYEIECGDVVEDGMAAVNVVWTAGSNAPYQSRSTNTDRSRGSYSAMYKSSGTYRDATMTASAKLDGEEILPVSQDSWGTIASLTSMSISKFKQW